MYYLSDLVFSLEKSLIPGDEWTEEIICKFPEDLREELRHPELHGPIGLGYRDDVGWFVLGCGQGPFVIYLEKNPKGESNV